MQTIPADAWKRANRALENYEARKKEKQAAALYAKEDGEADTPDSNPVDSPERKV